MTDLINQKCVPHEKMIVLTQEEIKDYLTELNVVPPLAGSGSRSQSDLERWEFLETNKIAKDFKFEDFVKAMNFVNKVADIAEKEGHHPDITIHYNKVEITLWSHFINGLSINDFILAAKIDNI